jgi:hypothetical protein
MSELFYRSAAILRAEGGGPASLDEDTRSVEAIGATEQPVMEIDRRTWEPIPTVLLMSGCQLPGNRQLPLLDNHSRYETASVLGSYRDIRVEGDKLVGRAVFSSAPEAEGAWLRTKEGHLTDFSVGRVDIGEPVTVPAGQTATVDGRAFTGPVRVVTRWQPKEMSVTPIGADDQAKVRSQEISGEPNNQQQEITIMADAENRVAANVDQPPAAHNEEKVDRGAIENEVFARATEIMGLCERFAVAPEVRAELLKPEVSLDQARARILDGLAKKSAENTPPFQPSKVELLADERDKFRAAASDALSIRGGLKVDAPAAGAKELAGYSLREIARESLRIANQPTGGDILTMVGRAMTTGDLPVLMSNVANKSLFEGYESAEETWQVWCATGSVNDFKTNTLAMVSEFDDLDQISENQPYRYGERQDAKETFQIVTYGKMFAITRQTIINDDLNGMVDTMMAMGEAAARKVGDLPYAVLNTNGNMRDGVALFNSTHGNLGTNAVIGEASIAEAIKLAKLQKNLKSKQALNIRLQYLIAPVSIEGAAEIFFSSNQFSAGAANTTAVGSTRNNPYAGSRFTRVYDARLDATSPSVYYFAGAKGKTVKVFFLGGNQSPYLETKQGWSVDGVEYKVRIDAAAKAVDWKAMVKIP